MEFLMRAIGLIRTPFIETKGMPIQPVFSDAVGQVDIFPEYAEGLRDLEGFSHIILIYALHRAGRYSLLVKPFLDNTERGVFATRHPWRPNPIGISTVRLLSRVGNTLEVEGIDVLDETPLLDIKPYAHNFDARSGAREGWYESRPAGKDGRS